jgi:hypothetical protein
MQRQDSQSAKEEFANLGKRAIIVDGVFRTRRRWVATGPLVYRAVP